jgi:hypothetical protein
VHNVVWQQVVCAFFAPPFASSENFGIAMVDAQKLLHRGVLQLWNRHNLLVFAPFGVYPSSRLKQKIHELTDADLDELNELYCQYATQDILDGEKSEIYVVFATSDRQGGVQSFRMERRIANDGIAYTKGEFIKHYGTFAWEWRWNAARKQDDRLSTEIARILREKTCEWCCQAHGRG